jgi:hypothetical protein
VCFSKRTRLLQYLELKLPNMRAQIAKHQVTQRNLNFVRAEVWQKSRAELLMKLIPGANAIIYISFLKDLTGPKFLDSSNCFCPD